jgi:hypothetical protein
MSDQILVMLLVGCNIFGFIMGTSFMWASFSTTKVWLFILGLLLCVFMGLGSLLYLTSSFI